MPRIADVLERESRTVDLEQGDFERLLDRRDRKQRNRRIRAGVLGIIVTLATAAVLARAMSSQHVPANPPVEPTPAPAAVSGALVYSSADGGIYVADPDGTNAVMITPVDGCQGPYRGPSWSPDGRYLAFKGCDGSVITDPKGKLVSRFPAAAGQPVWSLVWSPDSTRVARWDEASYDENGVGTFRIGVYGVDGTRETQIALPPGSDSGGRLVWAPDGASLIVNHLEVPVDGGTPRDLPFAEAFRAAGSGAIWDAALAYSPDGSQVAYGTRHALMVARGDWSEPREVLADPAHTAAWSPTGELIAVTSHALGGPVAPNQLRLVDPANGSATLLFEGEPGTWLEVIGFSPEGDRVLFSEQREVYGSYLHSLWSVAIDGSDAHQIVVGTTDGVVRPT